MLRFIASYSSHNEEDNKKLWHFIQHNRETQIDKLKEKSRSELFDVLVGTGILRPCWNIKMSILKRLEYQGDELYIYGDENEKLTIRLFVYPDNSTIQINIRWAN